MAQPSFIPRQTPLDDPDGIASLLRTGLAQLQRLSGNRWTDYNLHDPGVTLLELLCFALTDLMYRADFDVADYLTQPDGRLDFAAQGLMPPERIFPARPCTRQDYQRVIQDAVDDVERAWVTSDAQGRHRIDLLLSESARQRCEHYPALRDETIAAVTQVYHRNRNLCEDLADVRIIDSRGLTLYADIELQRHDNAEVLAAEIYVQAVQWLRGESVSNGSVTDDRHDEASLIDDHPTPDADPISTAKPVSALYTRLISIEGISHIRQLRLLPSSADEAAADGAVTHLNPGDWFLLPKKHDDIHLSLTHQSHPLPIDFSAMSIRLVRRQLQSGALREQIRRQAAALTPPPQGRWRALADYRSIQALFPAVYRLDAPRFPAAMNQQEQRQIQQFRGYLLLFEQLMANFCANLANLRALFSPALDTGRSYAFGLLSDEQFRGVDDLYPDDAASRFSALLAAIDHYPDRKGRVLDYLLALYGETLDARLWHQPGDASDDDAHNHRQLDYPSRFIQSIDHLTRDRGAGFNTCRPMTHRKNRGGFTERVALLLGMDDAGAWPYSQALARQGWRFSDAGDVPHHAGSPSPLQSLDRPALDRLLDVPLREAPAPGSAEAAATARDLHALCRHLLPVTLLQHGVTLARYRIAPPRTGSRYQALFRLSPTADARNTQWLYLGDSSRPAQLVHFINQLRRTLIQLNQQCEGVYVVEHLLLRPTLHPGHLGGDRFNGQLSLILPGYTARGGDPVFRGQAEALIARQCPAHLLPRCHWLGLDAMNAFEPLWLAWLDARRHFPGQPPCDEAAARLMALLQSLNSPSPLSQPSFSNPLFSQPQGPDA
ncbi:hypothetical protein [Dickeya chrysanthemi]|uniref:hypothetical protein n=1 Tax=Dickeya chrysanthemi TaxID=556 RepID=UPI000532E521|nr:hypothetical protein [Dickeya chrysanthemi]